MSKLFFPRSILWSRVACGASMHKFVAHSSVCRVISTNALNTTKPSSRIKWFWMPAGVGFALISFIQLRHIRDREQRKYNSLEVSDNGMRPWQVNLFKIVPTRALSRLWGKVHDVNLPVSLRGPVVRLWTWGFGCCLDEAEETDPTKYQNLGAFFTRKLKQGVREIDQTSELVSPVDGRVVHFGRLVDGRLEQVKGIPYSLDDFLGPRLTVSDTNENNLLYQCVLYLGPGDCHHFHSPTEWKIETRRHFAGELYSVSPWVLKGFRDILCTNERVTLYGNWKYGSFTMTAVGAYNVGSINISFDDKLKTNQAFKKVKTSQISNKLTADQSNGKPRSIHNKAQSFDELKFGGSMVINRGDHVGWFAMGSAIVLVFEAPKNFEFRVKHGEKVKLGEALGVVLKDEI